MAGRPSSNEKLAAVGLALLAVVSPLFIDRNPSSEPDDDDDEVSSVSLGSWLPLLLIVLIVAINMSGYLDKSFTCSDPYWIYRIGGSSCGIILLLMVLALVLMFKSSIG
ncbi:hypothetical protein IFM89_010331 [Coptis chinensis]|uniref:Transmembrane protein n=1 Tax=Coptis chinensis TaxID=261450 RepID=A0A835HPW0_9MAGN|nr:hypothetical protein IFM89_010331 [Coptis chinensis]